MSWRVATLTRWDGGWYAGELHAGRIFRLDWDYMMEGCDEHVSEFTTGVAHNNQNRMIFHGLEVVFDTGSAETTCSSAFAVEFLTISGDFPDSAVGDVF